MPTCGATSMYGTLPVAGWDEKTPELASPRSAEESGVCPHRPGSLV